MLVTRNRKMIADWPAAQPLCRLRLKSERTAGLGAPSDPWSLGGMPCPCVSMASSAPAPRQLVADEPVPDLGVLPSTLAGEVPNPREPTPTCEPSRAWLSERGRATLILEHPAHPRPPSARSAGGRPGQ